jgi:carboxy-cis,cis-muconate cyclase
MRVYTAFLHVLLTARALADNHHLFVSSFSSPNLYSLEFNDETKKLTQTGHIKGHDGHPWISFSYDKSALYAGERDGFASYQVDNATMLSYKRSVALKGACSQQIAGFGSTFILPLLKAPFTVYGAPFGSCVNSMSVEADGTLQGVIQNIELQSSSGIHGMAIDPESNTVYSADVSANGIWVHQVDPGTTNLKQLAFVPAPEPNAGPRHLIVHPNGQYLYVVMETRSEVAVYAINSGPQSDKNKITFTGMKYSLIPRGQDPALYKATEVLLSADNNILYASTRYKGTASNSEKPVKAAGPSSPGYVTAILLVPISEKQSPDASHAEGPGFPLRQLLQMKTTTSGGASNAISPAPWDRDYFAISDTEIGQVEIWKIQGGALDKAFYAGATGQDASAPARGGWQNGSWISAPAPPAPQAPGGSGAVPTSAPAPYQGGNPWQVSCYSIHVRRYRLISRSRAVGTNLQHREVVTHGWEVHHQLRGDRDNHLKEGLVVVYPQFKVADLHG